MDKQTGGPAYPTNNWQKTVPLSSGYHEGMTLRDYFAAKAMQGAIANEGLTFSKKFLEQCALDSYALADAMLKAREA